jgi:hypothetical protein
VKPDPDQPTDVKPDPAGQQPSAKPDAKKPEARPDPQTPGVRPSAVKVNDQVTIGGYGSVRYETNSLDEPKPAAGFDFRRFVLATDISPRALGPMPRSISSALPTSKWRGVEQLRMGRRLRRI